MEWKGEAVSLLDPVTGEKVPAQVAREGGQTFLCWIIDSLPAFAERSYEPCAPEGGRGIAEVRERQDRLDVVFDETLAASYHFGPSVARPFVNPLRGPEGKSVLRPPVPADNPQKLDHVHHRGLWVSHGDTNGCDNWSEQPGHGRTVHRAFEQTTGGPVFAELRVLGDWVDHSGRKILEEKRSITFYRLPEDSRIVDHRTVLTATEGEVVFKDTKESGLLSVRVATSMEVPHGGRIENAYGGVNEAETWGKRAQWCDYSGMVEGVHVGVAVMDHPSNIRHPTYWHVRDYGLMTANFFGLAAFHGDKRKSGTYILPAGESMDLRHRVLVHAGSASAGRVRERYLNYLFPPRCIVKD
jgi:hypothetical protein